MSIVYRITTVPPASNVAVYIVSSRCWYICIGVMSIIKSQLMRMHASRPQTGFPVTAAAARTCFVLGKPCSALLHSPLISWSHRWQMGCGRFSLALRCSEIKEVCVSHDGGPSIEVNWIGEVFSSESSRLSSSSIVSLGVCAEYDYDSLFRWLAVFTCHRVLTFRVLTVMVQTAPHHHDRAKVCTKAATEMLIRCRLSTLEGLAKDVQVV